jgi:hypothetical protein
LQSFAQLKLIVRPLTFCIVGCCSQLAFGVLFLSITVVAAEALACVSSTTGTDAIYYIDI